ncbi:MAG: SUMF1/EgtB/PvdO family nonheme iron enzyme [Muribaculaceae bacterium]|nr:SUMF1/EgtB/PvdO family nonheme iron enzyme [Muribaculaceae bacterium]
MATQKQYKYTLPVGYKLKGGENDYVIEEVLGKGGFGVTYKVKTTVQLNKLSFDVHCAVKEYFPDICSREADNATIKIPETKHDEIVDGISDFLNEGRKLQAVCDLNPNIVNVNEVFQANGTAYYVLEYLEGGDLRKMVKSNGGALSEQQMLDVMVPIGNAVQCLHDNNILHLDIKPDNIVMRHNSKGEAEPVLIDFGIAVHFRSDGTPTSKTPSQGISTGYSPIEQYQMVKKFDPRIDVYAFAATCLYLLTGHDPIEPLDMPQTFVRNELPQGIGSNVVTAIERGMAMNRNSRTCTISEMLAELEDIKEMHVPVESEKSPKKAENDTVNLTKREDALKPARGEKTIRKPKAAEKTSKASKRNVDKIKRRSKRKLIYLVSLFVIALLAGFVIWKTQGWRSFMTESEKARIINDYVNNMVYVEGGTFTMGATSEQGDDAFDEEKPAHEVTLSPYYIGQTEVTQELWMAVMGYNPSYFKGAKRPVECVSWDECQEFIRRLNEKTGKRFRLPTEAEWECAARGGKKSNGYKYSGSNNINDVAWYDENSGNKTHDVASKHPNELGIYDMSGNVAEWCSDWYGDDYYKSTPNDNPQGPSSGSDVIFCRGCRDTSAEGFRVCRGGCRITSAETCRVSGRDCSTPHNSGSIGLRLAL